MRGLIIFFFVGLSAAKPQGYSYSQEASQELPAQGVQGVHQKYTVDTPLVEGSLNALNFPSENLRRPFATYGVQPQHNQGEVLVSKKFFIHTAPEEEDDEVHEKVLTVGHHKKNYNVVFIRTPTKQQKAATVKIIPAPKEEKTVVYVLSKKDHPVDIHAHVEEVPTTTAKPEVYFIKYKTPEEANHAQGKIQAEYERLGGSTQVLNEGVSAVSSVIGSLHEKNSQKEHGLVAPLSAPAEESRSTEEFAEIPLPEHRYLPPSYY